MKRHTRLRVEPLDDRCLPSFSPATSFPVGNNPQAVATTDFNHDGNLDLATANAGGNTVSVLLGNGQGGFAAANHFATGASPEAIAVGDFDGDGNLDLATTGWTQFWPVISVLLGDGHGNFRPPVQTVIYSGESLAVAAGDFNGDGKSDLVYCFSDAMNWDNPAIEVLLSDGAGGFADRAYYELNDTWSVDFVGAVGLAVGDLNADGRADVATANDAGTVSVLLGNGDGTLSYSAGASNFTTGPSPRAVAVGDFTGDGIPDLVTAGQTVDVLPGLGGGRFGPAIRSVATGTGLTAMAVADFDGDGKLDVVTAGPAGVTVLLGRGDGTLAVAADHAPGSVPRAVAVGDFTGDGRPDVAAADAGSNTVAVLLNDGGWSGVYVPRLRIGDVAVTEGNAGTITAVFTVTLSAAAGQPVTVQYATANGTAISGADYQAAAGTLTFAPGETSKTVAVVVIGDRAAEPTEAFVVNLSNPAGAVVADGQGLGTIVDDEPRISIGDVTKAEGKQKQTTLFTFTVTLSAAYDQAVTVSYRTADGTAQAGEDYTAKTGTLTFAPGETTKTITIEVKGDNKREADEAFYLDLFGLSGNSLFTKNRGLGTILNDD